MLSVTLGPLALPVAPLLLVASVWLGATVASRLDRRRHGAAAQAAPGAARAAPQDAGPAPRSGPDAADAPRSRADAGDVLFHAAIAGLGAARVAFVALNLDGYRLAPVSVLDLRDGGWHAPTGLAVAVAWLGVRALRTRALGGPLAAGAIAAAVAWGAAGLALGRWDRPPMPGLALVALDGGATTSLAEAAGGRPAVVNLWASWCGPCRAEMPALVAAQRRTPGVAVLLVNQGESEAKVRDYLRREGLAPRDVLLDAGSGLGAAVGSGGLPTTLFFDAAGRRVDAHFGVLSDAALRARIEALGGRPPGPRE